MSYVYDPRIETEKLHRAQAEELLKTIVSALDAGLRPEQIKSAIDCRSREFFEMAEFLGAAEQSAADLTACGNLRALPGGGGCERAGLLAPAQGKVISICAILRQAILRISDDPKVELKLIDQRPSRN